MRISADRYNRDRLRYDLALHMMIHGARLSTVRAWTELSIDRLRKLYRAYLMHRTSVTASGTKRWPRGKVPGTAASFLHSSAMAFEATTLACVLQMLGLVSADKPGGHGEGGARLLQQGELLCQAYEIYLLLHPHSVISFERACVLQRALLEGDEVKLDSCGQCKRLYLTDAARVKAANCGCASRYLGLPLRRPENRLRPERRGPKLPTRAERRSIKQ